MIIYSKINTNRKPEFSTITKIELLDGIKSSSKTPLTLAAEPFVVDLVNKYEDLKLLDLPFSIVAAKQEGNSVRFDFIKGRSIAAEIEEYVKNKNVENAIDALSNFVENILGNLSKEKLKEEHPVFGSVFNDHQDFEWVKPGIVDLNLDNLIVDEGNKLWLIDYEWLWDQPVPLEYLQFRAIYYLISNLYSKGLDVRRLESHYNSLLNNKTFIKAEFKFQSYVSRYESSYEEFEKFMNTRGKFAYKYSNSIDELKNINSKQSKHITYLESEIAKAEQKINALNNEINDSRTVVGKMIEKSARKVYRKIKNN